MFGAEKLVFGLESYSRLVIVSREEPTVSETILRKGMGCCL